MTVSLEELRLAREYRKEPCPNRCGRLKTKTARFCVACNNRLKAERSRRCHIEDVIECWLQGGTLQACAKMLGVCVERFRQILHRKDRHGRLSTMLGIRIPAQRKPGGHKR